MITMIKSLGYIATWIASIAVLAATIIFGMAQTTTIIDSIVLCSILTALAIFGMTLSFIAKVEISEHSILSVKAPAIILIILVLGAVQTFEVYGWKSNIDFLFGESTQASKTDKLKIDLVQSKVKIMQVGNIDINSEANKLAEMEKKAAKCVAWRWDCKNKARAEKNAIELKLNAQKDSVSAINEAMYEIKRTESNSSNYVHRAFKGAALVADTEALKVQSIYRLTISALVVLLSHLGFVFYAGNDKRYVDIAKKIVNPSPAPQPAPAFKQTEKHHDPIFNRMFIDKKQNEIVAARPSESDYELNEMTRGISEFKEHKESIPIPEPKYITEAGFLGKQSLNPNHPDYAKFLAEDMPRVESTPKKASISINKPIPTPITRIDIPAVTQSNNDTQRGIAPDLEYEAIKNAILDGSYFDFVDIVGTNAIRKYAKMISPSGKGIGQAKAIRFVGYAKADRLPMAKDELKK